MKTMLAWKWSATLALAAALTAGAQGQGGNNRPPPPEGGPDQEQGGPGGGDFQPPSADEIAKHILADFDADKDGKLSADELTKSIAAHQKERMSHGGPMGGPGGGQQRRGGGQRSGGGQGGPGGGQQQQGGPGGQQGDRPTPPAPEKIAAKWLEDCDADKNGSLSKDELIKALESHRPPRPPRPPMQDGEGGPGGFGPPDA